ncbi:EAL domain-containing protein [Lactobacillus delbrueckii]|uniref:EAL domain-containing protein n=1 Tax=Lactobacillus delbrueckii TaxID=1584 RepID=UPI003994E952
MAEALYQFTDQERVQYETTPLPLLVLQVIDGEYHVLLASDEYCKMVGSDRESMLEYLNHHSFGRVHPADVVRLATFSASAIKYPECHLTYRLSIKGEYHTLFAHSKRIKTEDGTILLLVSYFDLGNDQSQQSKEQSESPNIDLLTGMPNVSYFSKFGDDFLRKLLKQAGQVDVIYFDISSLHSYNDHFGFLQGNQLIKKCGEIIRASFQEGLTLRYVDDSFLTITAPSQLKKLLPEIQKKVADFSADKVTTVRAGVYQVKEMESATSAVDKAYLALRYMGDDRHKAYQVYNTSVKKRFEMQDYLMGHFEEALSQNWLKVYYQPIFNLYSKKICSFEAVSRWQEPGKPALKASHFIPVLERSGLVYQLDLHVLDHVCRLLNQSRADNLPTVPVSINLSPSDFNIDGFTDQVVGITQKYQIPHKMIHFDLIAQPMASDQQRLKDAAASLQKQGFQICLDRYGNDNSDLSTETLLEYNFDYLKVDVRSFNTNRQRAKIILASVINMSRLLKIVPVVKGVEDRAMLNFIRSLGIMLTQGRLLAKEMPEEKLSQERDNFEIAEERALFSGFSHINVLDPYLETQDRLDNNFENPRPSSIFIIQSRQGKLVYCNSAFRSWTSRLGYNDTEAFVKTCNGAATGNYSRLWTAIGQCKQVNEIAQFDWITDQEQFKVRLQLISKTDNLTAFLSDGYKVKNRTPQKDYQQLIKDGGGLGPGKLRLALLENSNVGLFWKNAKLEYLGANQRFLDYFGLQLKDILGEVSCPDPTDGLQTIQGQEEQLLKDGVALDDYMTDTDKDKHRTFHYFLSPIYDGNSICGLLGFIMDVTSQMDELTQLRVEAARDPLTTLKNRRSFDRDFGYLTQRDISVMMIDIDYFKTFNDKFGHLYGDAVLKKISEALLHVYGIGHCYRYGGDEFLVIEDFESKDRLRKNDQKVRKHLEQVKILDLKFDIHISAGYVYGQAQTPDEVYEMIREADHMLYKSKENGRNQISGGPSRYN